MFSATSLKLIEDFNARRISLKAFSDALDDLLFELRQTATMTPEKWELSGMQAVIHELHEGTRTVDEVYSYAKDLLDSERAVGSESAPRRANSSRLAATGQ